MTTYVDERGTEVSPPDWQVDSLRRLGLIHEVTFDCPDCDHVSPSKAGLASHRRVHDEEES